MGRAVGTGPTLRQRQQERTRGDIVRAALRVISVDGIAALTIDRISAEAGMSRATLYAHYPDGQDEIVRAAYDQLGSDLLSSARQGAAGHEDWIERLTAYARAMVALAEDPQLGFFYNIGGPSRVGLHRQPGVGSRGYRDAFERELTGAQQAGDIGADVDAAATAAMLVGMMRQTGIDVARDPSWGPRCVAAFRRIVRALAER